MLTWNLTDHFNRRKKEEGGKDENRKEKKKKALNQVIEVQPLEPFFCPE